MSGEMGSSGDVVVVELEASNTKQSGFFVPLGKSTRIQHLSAATGLILTYLIEIGVQISLTIHFCESWIPLSSIEWGWVWLVILSVGISSLVVSSISLIWVCQSLDFAGRLCGRLLCYVMPVFLLGIPWRYLKLAFAYDPADVQEFVALRIFQTYIQSLPLTTVHLACLITFHESWTCAPVWLVVAECVSIVIALILASYITPLPSPGEKGKTWSGKTTRSFQENLKCSTSPSAPGDESDLWCRVVQIELNLLSRGLLLACRLVSLGLLLSLVKSWTPVFILLHLILGLTWFHVMTTPGQTLSHSLKCSYVIFWDVTSTLCGELDLMTWSGPMVLVMVENVGILTIAHWQFQDLRWLITGTSASILFGSSLFSLLNLSRLTPWRTLFGTRVQRIPSNQSQLSGNTHSSSSSSEGEESKERENSNLVLTSTHYMNISERLMTTEQKFGRKKEHDSAQWATDVTPPRGYHSSDNSGLGQAETWVPETCCNDSNGSSNSRNTNTLHDPVTLDSLNSSDFVFYFPSGRKTELGRLPPKQLPLVTSTPLEIKTAARVIMNYPRQGVVHKKGGSRCRCKSGGVVSVPENLIEDPSFGILFCESGESPGNIPIQSSRSQSRMPLRSLRILCAKCLQNHDPLLTDCQEDNEKIVEKEEGPIGRLQSINPILPSETTDYPSETEMTWTGVDEEEEGEGDEESGVTSLHSRPLTPTQHPSQTQMWTMFPPWTTEEASLPQEFTSREYVRTWLLSSQTLQRHHHYQQKMGKDSKKSKTIHLPIFRSNNQRRVNPQHHGPSFESGKERRESHLATFSRNNLFYKDLEIIV